MTLPFYPPYFRTKHENDVTSLGFNKSSVKIKVILSWSVGYGCRWILFLQPAPARPHPCIPGREARRPALQSRPAHLSDFSCWFIESGLGRMDLSSLTNNISHPWPPSPPLIRKFLSLSPFHPNSPPLSRNRRPPSPFTVVFDHGWQKGARSRILLTSSPFWSDRIFHSLSLLHYPPLFVAICRRTGAHAAAAVATV